MEAESTWGNSRKSRKFSPPGEMRPISAEESRGLSHLNSGTFKGSFTPLLQLKKFPDIPVSTRDEARESRPHPEDLRFRLIAREEGSFHCVVGKEVPAFPSHLKRRRSPQERPEELQVMPPLPESPRCLSPFQGNLFPWTASTFKPRIDSHHGGTWDSPAGKPCGKASWESLEGKPRGNATDPLFHVKERVTLRLQLGRK